MQSCRIALFSAFLLAGCGDDVVRVPGADSAGSSYRATVRRTSFGIPHITGDDLGSVAFGLGHSGAEDFVCTLADQILKVRSERAKLLGRGDDDANVKSDLAYLALRVAKIGEESLAVQGPEMRELIDGYVAGYNLYLARTGPAGLPAPCTNAAWVRPITPLDLSAYYVDLTLRGSSIPFLEYVLAAAPPGAKATGGDASDLPLPDFRDRSLGSNGWAIGRERSSAGRGMLVGNPHFPWEGELRFYESHLTVPGMLEVYGASLLGVPVINIGFNRNVAWTHTVTPSHHFTVYQLELVPGDPTSYLVDGQPKKMTSEDVSIDVLEEDGAITTQAATFWRSHHGPMVVVPGTPVTWDESVAFTYRDANETNARIGEQWFRMNRATSLEELRQVHADVQGIPWVYTIATDDDGNAALMDGSRVPNLSQEAEDAYVAALAGDVLVQGLAAAGVVLLDGSTSMNDWVDVGKADAPGLVPFEQAPQLERADFAMNANDSPWLANPAAPLTEYAYLYGPPRTPSSPRTRMNLVTLSETGDGSPSGADGKFTLEELQAAVLLNRSIVAEDLRADVVARCTATPSVMVQGQAFDLAPACAVLAAWDGRYDKASVGAIVWREMVGQLGPGAVDDAGTLYANPFDPDQPVTTPNGLAPVSGGDDKVLVALAKGVVNLVEAGLDVDTSLGDAQFTWKGDQKIGLHGGGYVDGITNIITWGENNSTLLPGVPRGEVVQGSTNLTVDGYVVNYGTSFVMAMEFGDSGPRAVAMISYSESSDPASPHFADQTLRFSDKGFRPCLFEDADIGADPELTTVELEAPR